MIRRTDPMIHKGNEVFRFDVRAEGINGHNRMVQRADTPLGVYNIPESYPWIKGGGEKRVSYGPNYRLNMEPESGEIIKSKRDNIRIHGGRQEDRNNDGNWVKKAKPELKKTEGCLRAYDDDMKTFKTKTDDLQKNNRQEKPGKVYVIDDLDEFIKQEQSK